MTEPIVAQFPAGPKIRELASKTRLPPWLLARLAHMVDDLPTVLAGLRSKPPQYLRVNTIVESQEEVLKRLRNKGFTIRPTKFDPNVAKIVHAPMSPGATLEHLKGMTTMQDIASASAPLALGAQPGDRVADLAAAPGVKTLHVAADMQNTGALVAIEPDELRRKSLRFNLERCRVVNTVIRGETAQEIPGQEWADRVLVDAPCTGEGTIPKDRKKRRREVTEVAKLAQLQTEILDAADRILRPGGTLVYATCTFAPEENEAQVQRLLERGYRIESLPFSEVEGSKIAPGITEWPGHEFDSDLRKMARFYPGLNPTLGFTVAKLTKGGK